MTKIDELKKLAPDDRTKCLERTYKKNKKFFSEKHPDIAKLLYPGAMNPFHIHVSGDFLTITNTETGELCHPEVGLDRFSEMLGDWTNKAWIDLIEGRVVSKKDYGKYSQFSLRFQKSVICRFPGLLSRMNERAINLPVLPNGKRFSNPVVFAGIFHGLHIDHYLSCTQLRNVAFVEPDCARFALSCYFLDYQVLDERFNGLILHVGGNVPQSFISTFVDRGSVSGAVWVRILKGYASDKFERLIRQVRLEVRKPYDVWVPLEVEIEALCNAVKNMRAGDRVYDGVKKLSGCSRIAVVGAGPSLSNDLDWLTQNQNQIVVFAAHSAVSALKNAGIIPDFQFTLDIGFYDQDIFDRLQLDPSIPIVTLVSDQPNKFAHFNEVLRMPEAGGVYSIHFNRTVPFLSPTTGNMALGFACHCRPEEIYLFGLDFGYRQATETHVAKGSAYVTEEQHGSILGSGHLQVETNFKDAEDVYTQSYFNFARILAQKPIIAASGQVRVFNCSDGVRIDGAVPCCSSEIKLREYDKSQDVDMIRSMFVPAKEGVHWEALSLDGAVQLAACKKAMLQVIKMKKFNWVKFSEKVDNFNALTVKRLPNNIAQNLDGRVVPYLAFVKDLLINWYKLLCFTNSETEWQQVYEEGYAQLGSLIDELEWPDELK
ncbi:MAG: putative Rossmann fold enzyme [Desulforhopalus sp.]|jgi:uncharacterized Rossmann fold enzyme